MAALIVKDDGELRRVQRTIAEFEARPPMERLRKSCLLQALYAEREELLRVSPQRRHSSRALAA
ncbi:MAG TPA: hypothetical protein VLV85_19935 [Stellaceae bacterium]|jgi:hypothetical protein|nr:hypothetical protein [Stellaceae bacterium]